MGVTAAAIAGGVALFGMAASDRASSAAAQNANAQTEEQWFQGELQKALNNGCFNLCFPNANIILYFRL